MNRKGVFRNSDYAKTIQIWKDFYFEHQVHIAFFDQLGENPRSFFKDTCSFLGLDHSDQFIPRMVHKKRFASQNAVLPDYFASYLAHQYYALIEQLHQQFDNLYTAKWLDFAQRHL